MLELDTNHGIEPAARTFVSQGLTLNYLDWGNEGAPLLIFIHGASDHARSWDWTARALRGTFHVVALDLRGHGDSQWSPDGAYLPSYHVIDLAGLIDILGQDQVLIVAHSFGGYVASRYAGLFPHRVQKLVLVDGFGPSLKHYAQWAEAGLVERMREWISQRRGLESKTARRLATIGEAATRMNAKNPRLSMEQALFLAEHGVRQHSDGYGWKFDPRVNQFAAEDFCIEITVFWREITSPTLLCRGGDSWTEDPDVNGQAASLRNHSSIAIEKAGHWPHHDQFEIFTATIRDFLQAQ